MPLPGAVATPDRARDETVEGHRINHGMKAATSLRCNSTPTFGARIGMLQTDDAHYTQVGDSGDNLRLHPATCGVGLTLFCGGAGTIRADAACPRFPQGHLSSSI